MSKTLKVIYSKTFTISTPIGDQWEKVGAEEELTEGETREQVWTEVANKVKEWHMSANKEYYDSLVIQKGKPPTIDRTKAEPDIIILKKYNNAVSEGDEKTKLEIEANYNI